MVIREGKWTHARQSETPHSRVHATLMGVQYADANFIRTHFSQSVIRVILTLTSTSLYASPRVSIIEIL